MTTLQLVYALGFVITFFVSVHFWLTNGETIGDPGVYATSLIAAMLWPPMLFFVIMQKIEDILR